MDWSSLFKIESIIKEAKVTLNGWFSNWNFLNRNNSPVTKTTNNISIEKIEKLVIVQAKQLPEVPDQTSPERIGNTIAALLPSGLADDIGTKNQGELKQSINKRIDEAVALMNLGRIDEARTLLLTILGEIKVKADFGIELGRVYNNLGVTYNKSKPDGDFEKACEYFTQAVAADPNSWKAKMNLAQSLINRGDDEGAKKGLDQIKALWEIEKNAGVLQVMLWGIYKVNKGPDKVFEFIKTETTSQAFIEQNDTINNLLAAFHLEKGDFESALIYADKALLISPNEPEFIAIKAKALMIRAQEKNTHGSDQDLIPHFSDFQDVNEALALYKRAEEIAQQQKKNYLMPEIHYGICTCLVWLGRFEESKNSLQAIKLDELNDAAAHHINVLNFTVHLYEKDFELAYNTLLNNAHYSDLSYREKRRVARIFLLNGATEQAKLLLDSIAVEAERLKDVYYWFEISTTYVLLDKHQEAITAATKAKKLADEQADMEIKKLAYTHYNAVMHHYSKHEDGEDSETGRLLSGMAELQKLLPEEKILVPIQAQDDKGELTQEIKDIFISARDRFTHIKHAFKNNPIPIYYLEKVFNRPLADLMARREDPDFVLPFTGTDQPFLQELDNNFTNAKGFIFDYLSLLDLAKMDFLGFLEKLGKPIYIHELLFQKIQDELLQVELPELRKLWDFLRKSKSIKIIRGPVSYTLAGEKLEDFFDEWLVETLKYAASEEVVLVTNDLRLYAYSKSEKIKPVNVTVFLKNWKDQGIVDSKMNARATGDLAERYYTFLPYNGEDLFEIVLEDKSKITPRSYHLVNEVFLPGSITESFIGVFAKFIDMLWKTGSLPQEKVSWVKFLSKVITEIIDKEYLPMKNLHQGDPAVEEIKSKLKPLLVGLAFIWKAAAKNGNKDDLAELLKIVDEVLDKEYLSQSKETIRKLITDNLDLKNNGV